MYMLIAYRALYQSASMAQASQSTVRVVSGRSLYRVNQVIRDEQMSQLKLFAIIMNAPVASISKATEVSEVLDTLNGKFTRKMAAALLQSMLTVLEVKTDTVALLGSAQEDLEASTELDKFTFGVATWYDCR